MREQGIQVGRAVEPEYPEVEVYRDIRWAYDAFWRMSASRPVSMDGPLRISVTEVNAWAQLHRYLPERAYELLLYVDAMDRAYMAHVREVKEEEEGKKAKKQQQNQQPNTPAQIPSRRPPALGR